MLRKFHTFFRDTYKQEPPDNYNSYKKRVKSYLMKQFEKDKSVAAYGKVSWTDFRFINISALAGMLL